MRLCYISKYPPVQGGVSRQNFWMARALADRGIEVHLVTNAPEVEEGFRIVDLLRAMLDDLAARGLIRA